MKTEPNGQFFVKKGIRKTELFKNSFCSFLILCIVNFDKQTIDDNIFNFQNGFF
jgi:hypothetical protein